MNKGLAHINSIDALKTEQLKIKERLMLHEREFKRKFQQMPAEVAAASANNFIPKILRGKITNSALNGGKFLINKLFVTEDDKPNFVQKASKKGIFTFAKTVFRMIKGK